MIRRFRLGLKADYEKLVIAQRLADMLDCFIAGRLAPIEMGSEQGGIPEWDDFVVRHSGDLLEHLQIKKQSTHFCQQKSTKPNAGAELSVIDKAFISLADWTRPANNNPIDSRIFILSLSNTNLEIKKGLRADHLDELCGLFRRDGVSVDALAARGDGPTNALYEWLTTWCNFEDWLHIKTALERVTIRVNGIDADLRERALAVLSRHFTNGEKALDALVQYVGQEAADVVAIRCRPTLRHLYDQLRPGTATWTQYRLDSAGAPWNISGTHDIQSELPESSEAVVRELWNIDGKHKKLIVSADYEPLQDTALSLRSAILRLAVHLQGAKQGLMNDSEVWAAEVSHKLGRTLGIDESDLENLPWIENTEKLECESPRELSGVAAARKEAEALALAMDNEVWALVVKKLTERLGVISDYDLLVEMEATWRQWRESLERDFTSRKELLSLLLYPQTEGKNATHALRVGPRTVGLIVTAIETLLLVAVGLGEKTPNWKYFSNCGPVFALALKQWSGPVGGISAVRDLSSDGLFDVVGPVPAPIVVLSGIEAPPSSLMDIGMADDVSIATSMGSPRLPQLLVTRSKVSYYLRSGTLLSVRDHFGRQWRGHDDARQAAIDSVRVGV